MSDIEQPAQGSRAKISDDALFNIATDAWSTQTDASWSSNGLEAAINAVRDALANDPAESEPTEEDSLWHVLQRIHNFMVKDIEEGDDLLWTDEYGDLYRDVSDVLAHRRSPAGSKTGIEAAELVEEYINMRCVADLDAGDAANIIHILHEHGLLNLRYPSQSGTAIPSVDNIRKAIADEWGSHVCYHDSWSRRSCRKDNKTCEDDPALGCRCEDIAKAIASTFASRSQPESDEITSLRLTIQGQEEEMAKARAEIARLTALIPSAEQQQSKKEI
jgi:hypothetical protein